MKFSKPASVETPKPPRYDWMEKAELASEDDYAQILDARRESILASLSVCEPEGYSEQLIQEWITLLHERDRIFQENWTKTRDAMLKEHFSAIYYHLQQVFNLFNAGDEEAGGRKRSIKSHILNPSLQATLAKAWHKLRAALLAVEVDVENLPCPVSLDQPDSLDHKPEPLHTPDFCLSPPLMHSTVSKGDELPSKLFRGENDEVGELSPSGFVRSRGILSRCHGSDIGGSEFDDYMSAATDLETRSIHSTADSRASMDRGHGMNGGVRLFPGGFNYPSMGRGRHVLASVEAMQSRVGLLGLADLD